MLVASLLLGCRACIFVGFCRVSKGVICPSVKVWSCKAGVNKLLPYLVGSALSRPSVLMHGLDIWMLNLEPFFCFLKVIDENMRHKVNADATEHCRQKIERNRYL